MNGCATGGVGPGDLGRTGQGRLRARVDMMLPGAPGHPEASCRVNESQVQVVELALPDTPREGRKGGSDERQTEAGRRGTAFGKGRA